MAIRIRKDDLHQLPEFVRDHLPADDSALCNQRAYDIACRAAAGVERDHLMRRTGDTRYEHDKEAITRQLSPFCAHAFPNASAEDALEAAKYIVDLLGMREADRSSPLRNLYDQDNDIPGRY